jgi:hypothetical protein
LNKLIEATCLNGIVKDGDNAMIEGAEIQSEGVAQSSGFAFIEKGKVIYFTKTSGDLKTVIEKIISCLTIIETASSSWGSPVTFTEKSELTNLKDNLK